MRVDVDHGLVQEIETVENLTEVAEAITITHHSLMHIITIVKIIIKVVKYKARLLVYPDMHYSKVVLTGSEEDYHQNQYARGATATPFGSSFA